MSNKLLVSCVLCRNELTSNHLKIHYGSKQCQSGILFSKRVTKRVSTDMKCKFCAFVGKNSNSIAQHEIYCKSNPNRRQKIPSYGMKGKKGKGSNQYINAKILGLLKPQVSQETSEKLKISFLKNFRHCYASKEGNRVLETLLDMLKNVHYGKVYSNKNGREYFLKKEKKIFFYDCCFVDLKIMIEYQGIAYHPKSLQDNWRPPFKNMGSKEQCWEKDRLKESLAKSKGFDIFYIWSDSVDTDLQNIVKNILQKISLKV